MTGSKAMKTTIPLFPLNTVLFPGGVLPLRIFEPRYLDMVSQCLRTDCGIGVVLIQQGQEVGKAAETFNVGTLCKIRYWNRRPDGMLGVTLEGEQRFSILSRQVNRDQSIQAEVELLPEIIGGSLAESRQYLARILDNILSQLEPPYSTMQKQLDDEEWVASRLIELLPLDMEVKQRLLSVENASQKLAEVASVLKQQS
ncbi:MAG: LON peptidase substrate-binding domain-containing protein [Pseudomonadota bacterium]|nr:LON peptidase substrate-binding domain-containing protein [Pseudomonadota bacterium]